MQSIATPSLYSLSLLTLAFAVPAGQEPRSEPEAAPVSTAVVAQEADGLFAPATEGLALAWPVETDGLTMLDLAHAYGEATSQRLAITQETRQVLSQMPAPLDRATSIPADEVQGFVESLLRSSDCVLTMDRASSPRLVGVHSLRSNARGSVRSRAIHVMSDRRDLMRKHPAVLFSTVVDLPHSDVRQLSNSMRSIITDSNTQQMLPAGNSHSMLLVGFGPSVADLVEQLEWIDAASALSSVTVSHELIRLKNANAAEIASTVETALRTSRDIRTEHLPTQGPRKDAAPLSVLADIRLNGLLVTCRSDDVAAARQIIAQLDVE